MPNLNTFSAAVLAATILALPASAGQPSGLLAGGPTPYTSSTSSATATAKASASTSASTIHRGYSAAKSSASAYSDSSAANTHYAPTPVTGSHGTTRYVDTMTLDRPAHVITDNIVCMVQGREVPCDSIPGLADALRGQGMHSIADQLPQVPHALYYDESYIAARGGNYGATTQYYQAGHSTGATSYSYQSKGTGYTTTGVATPVYGPCGEFIGMRCGAARKTVVRHAPAPVTVHLDDGTVYALNGGVGTGVYGEFYGGGGTLIEGGGSYSGVTEAAGFWYGTAMSTYGYKGGHKGGHGGGGHHGCKSGKCGGGHYDPGKPHKPHHKKPVPGYKPGGHDGCKSGCGSSAYYGKSGH